MVYSTAAGVQAWVPNIASTREGVKGFITRLVMQTVLNVLESQARSVLLPGPVFSAILSQLTVTITYEPMECKKVIFYIVEEADIVLYCAHLRNADEEITGGWSLKVRHPDSYPTL
ncbi:hypothetical protein KIN20_036391 [Parelaphostrongylus tenuis]|uniref:Uncharacterized protein n=1 Tax=Parelaphostrongylus tenuis TaxID=148309 RepID=A0AAD5RCJ8_PARTN|nr:hypothetical protein KIN20_036391 [Parelaphostrongylus tenuis]